MVKIIAWAFAPTPAEIASGWVAPAGYIRAQTGELRLKLASDTPMDDTTVFEPGWKRAQWLDRPAYPLSRPGQNVVEKLP